MANFIWLFLLVVENADTLSLVTVALPFALKETMTNPDPPDAPSPPPTESHD